MAIERNPNDPYAASTNDDALRRSAQLDNELQADPELAEGPASGGRIALFAIALVAILGVVFYGLNSSSTSPDATPTAQTAPSTPSGGMAQTPRAPAGQTTGSAMKPVQPAPPPAANAPAPAANTSSPAAPQTNSAPAGAPSTSN